MTHLSFSVPSLFFLTEQDPCSAIKEKEKNDDDVKGMRKKEHTSYTI